LKSASVLCLALRRLDENGGGPNRLHGAVGLDRLGADEVKLLLLFAVRKNVVGDVLRARIGERLVGDVPHAQPSAVGFDKLKAFVEQGRGGGLVVAQGEGELKQRVGRREQGSELFRVEFRRLGRHVLRARDQGSSS
jgi:Arc/MetJ family transcription regulator